MTLPLRIEQVDPHAFEQNLRIVEVAVFAAVGVHAARDRARQQLAEVVFDARLAPVDRDLADHVARRRNVGHAAQVARRVDAVEPAGRVDFHHRVRAGGQVVELVEAGGVGRGPQARVVAAAVEQLHHHAADAFFRPAIEHAVVVAVVIDVARKHHADLLAEVVLNRVETRRDVDAGEDAVHARHIVLRAAGRADPLAAVVVFASADARGPDRWPARGR